MVAKPSEAKVLRKKHGILSAAYIFSMITTVICVILVAGKIIINLQLVIGSVIIFIGCGSGGLTIFKLKILIMRHYFSYEEDEAYKEGKRDEERNRTDYYHDKYAYDGEDRAYWDGRKDEQEAERRREEEREDEERREREEERRNHERRERAAEYERQQEEYERQRYEDDMREIELEKRREIDVERQFENDCATEEYINEIPITEEELFNQIQEDERRDQGTESDSD